MKLNRMMTMCAMVATLALSVGSTFAQDNGGNNGDQQNGGQRRFRQAGGGQGGDQGGPGGQGGGRNFDPAQMQQRMLERAQEQLGFTNDVEWDAVKPLVQKVQEAQMSARAGQMRGMFGGGRNRGGGNGGGNGMFPADAERDALQKAVDDNAPASQVKDLLAKYKASQKAKQAKLEAAQADLKKVLSTKQEAQAVLSGLIN
jgi:hypothetical protein